MAGNPWEDYQKPATSGNPWEDYQKPATRSWSDVPGEALSNIPASAGKAISGLASAVAHPLNTVMGAWDAAAGGLYNALPKQVTDFLNKFESHPENAKRAIDTANAVGGVYKDRYGSVEAIKKTLTTDPIGAAMDISTVLSGGAGLLRGAAKASIPGAARAADALSTAARYTNPLVAAEKVASPALRGVAKGAGWVADAATGRLAQVNAGRLARDVAGPELGAIQSANALAPSDINAAQAAYGIDRRAWQSLADLAKSKDTGDYYDVLARTQNQNRLNALSANAGGENQINALMTRQGMKSDLNATTTPMREAEIAAANEAGKKLAVLQPQFEQLAQAAKDKVQDVRRFTAAGERAGDKVSSIPYMADLQQKAADVVNAAANDSLDLGEAARFKKMQIDSLAEHGLQPLTTDNIVRNIQAKLSDPKIGVDDLNRSVLTNVAQKIQNWTNKGTGVIDGSALYEIRKGAVNSEIDRLMPTADATVKAKRAAGLLKEIRPLIDDAITRAGGTGWKEYLDTFSSGMHDIDVKKMAAKALDLYQTSPDSFLKLVQGNDLKTVEKVFGAGSADIVKEMGANFAPLKKAADELVRDQTIAEQAKAGVGGLAQILDKGKLKLKLPHFAFNPKITIANQALGILEGKINRKTMGVLVEGMKTGKSANDMLSVLPTSERNTVLKYLSSNPKLLTRKGVLPATVVSNALSTARDNQNAMTGQ